MSSLQSITLGKVDLNSLEGRATGTKGASMRRWGKVVLTVAALATSALLAGGAQAAQWLTPGSGCAVNTGDVGLASQFIGRVEFRPGIVGQIFLYCPVTPGVGVVQGSDWTLDLYNRDSTVDFPADQAFVAVRLVKMHLRTKTTIPVLGCGFIRSAGGTSTTRSARCTESFDPNTYMYFAEVDMRRTSSTQAIQFLGLSLFR